MQKFDPPELRQKKGYSVQDIITLSFLNDFPTQIKNPMLKLTGGSHEYEILVNNISYKEVLTKLSKGGLIRVNSSSELLSQLTVKELRQILKNLHQKISGTKKILIDRVKRVASKNDIAPYENKNFFVLTEKGKSTLAKFHNVVWINKHKKYIYLLMLEEENSLDIKFDEYYFMNHLKENAAQTIINYYESRDSGIVARTYLVINDSKNAFYYYLRKFGENFDQYIERFKSSSSNCQNFINSYHFNTNAIINLYRSLNLQPNNLNKLANYIYNISIKNKVLVSKTDFSKLIFAFLEDKSNNYEMLKKVYDTVFTKIRERYPLPEEPKIVAKTTEEKEQDEVMACVEFFNFFLGSYDYNFFSKVFSKLPEEQIEMLEEISYQQLYYDNL